MTVCFSFFLSFLQRLNSVVFFFAFSALQNLSFFIYNGKKKILNKK